MFLLPELNDVVGRGNVALDLEVLVLELCNGHGCQHVCDPSMTNNLGQTPRYNALKGRNSLPNRANCGPGAFRVSVTPYSHLLLREVVSQRSIDGLMNSPTAHSLE